MKEIISEKTTISLQMKVFFALIISAAVFTSTVILAYSKIVNEQKVIIEQHEMILKKVSRIECFIIPATLGCEKRTAKR